MDKTFKEYINEGVVSVVAAISFTKLLTTPFEKWKSCKMGLIDNKGKILRKPKTSEEKKQFGVFENIARKIKILFHKFVPDKKYLSLLFAMYLLKKESVNSLENILKEELNQKLTNDENKILISILYEISNSSKSVGDGKEIFFVGKNLSQDEARKKGLKRIIEDSIIIQKLEL